METERGFCLSGVSGLRGTETRTLDSFRYDGSVFRGVSSGRVSGVSAQFSLPTLGVTKFCAALSVPTLGVICASFSGPAPKVGVLKTGSPATFGVREKESPAVVCRLLSLWRPARSAKLTRRKYCRMLARFCSAACKKASNPSSHAVFKRRVHQLNQHCRESGLSFKGF
eukprot:1914064-Rhodomonas_salina.2